MSKQQLQFAIMLFVSVQFRINGNFKNTQMDKKEMSLS